MTDEEARVEVRPEQTAGQAANAEPVGPVDWRVLFLGIGGTGKEILSRLKGRLLEVSGGTLPSSVGFLLIDVDPDTPRYSRPILDPESELCQPGRGNRPMMVMQAIRDDVSRRGPYKFIADRVPPGEMTLKFDVWIDGTERYRQAGLLAYLWEESRAGVSTKLGAAIKKLTAKPVGTLKLNIFIVCSVCGGTGSGMLIDTALLARGLGLQYCPHVVLAGVLLLPHVFESAVDPRSFDDLKSNALATLTELDYYMYSATEREGRTLSPADARRTLYRNKRDAYDIQGSILQTAILVENKHSSGGTLGDAQFIFPAVADILAHLSGAVAGGKFLQDLNNGLSTLARDLQGAGRDDPHFSSLGLARIILPVRRMGFEAVNRLSQDLLGSLLGSAEQPADAAITAKVQELGLTPEKMLTEAGLARPLVAAALARSLDLKTAARRLQRLSTVSDRVAEISRQKLEPETLRSNTRNYLDRSKTAVYQMLEAARQGLAQRMRRCERAVEGFGNALLTEGGSRGLRYAGETLHRTLARLEKQIMDLKAASAQDRADDVLRKTKAQEKAEDALGGCRSGAIKTTALRAARATDDWINAALEYESAYLQSRILDAYVTQLKQALEASRQLTGFLADIMPGAVGKATKLRVAEWDESRPITEICVSANGLEVYEQERFSQVRSQITASCLSSLGFNYRRGTFSLVGRKSPQREEPGLVISLSPAPDDMAKKWVDYLVPHAEQAFEHQRLDDYISSQEEATDYARRCLMAADVFLTYNVTLNQQLIGGDPVRITSVSPPAGSRLHEAFKDMGVQGLVAQDKDPTSAVVLRADVGILGSVLGFRQQALALENNLVGTPGLWTLGQLSHNIFWGDERRREDLRLFFWALAGDLIVKRPTPSIINAGGGASADYFLPLGRDAEVELGRGLQEAILMFLNPNNSQHRDWLREQIAKPEVDDRIRVNRPKVYKEALALLTRSAEVKMPQFATVLRALLNAPDDAAAPDGATPAAPKVSGRLPGGKPRAPGRKKKVAGKAASGR